MRKFSLLCTIILILTSFQSMPQHVFASGKSGNNVEQFEAYVVAQNDEQVEVYEDKTGKNIKTVIPSHSVVTVFHYDEIDDFVEIRYVDLDEKDQIIIGYIDRDLLVVEDEEEQTEENVEVEDHIGQAEKTEEDSEQNANAFKQSNDDQKNRSETVRLQNEHVKVAKQAVSRLEGIALKSPTNVYAEKSTRSNVLKSYRQGHILIFSTDDHHWYGATVYINGVKHTGYIYHKDVDIIEGEEVRQEGDALLPTVSVYERPSKEAKPLKSYPYGKKLIYRTYSSKWHLATVYIKGVAHTGYIYAGDVSPSVQGESIGKSLTGVGLKIPTNVYASMSRDSKVLRSYKQGHLLKFREYEANWYIATVYLNGVATTGYIHKDDVGNPNSSLRGYAQKAPTNVYSDMSRQSTVLKSYAAGHQLIYRPHNNNWYAATVIINGVRHTGYISHEDVGNQLQSITQYALKQPTNVYAEMSRNSTVLKSYKRGHLLKFQPYEKDWYKAVVLISGVRKTGYIHHSDVGIIRPGRTVVIDAGHGGHDPGTSGNGIVEKSLVLSLSKLAKSMLEDAGINVIMTREKDEYLTLGERSRIANNSNADLFLSIHGNAFNGTASGIETYWYDKYASTESERLAQLIQQEVIRETGARSRGVKKGNFHVIRETKIPSALLEVGFIDHPEEAEKLKQESYQRSIVRGIVNGIMSFLK